jgi:hypothetical protein
MTNYIYGLRDPRDGKIKYVGHTRNPRARYAGHVGLPAGRGLNAKEQWVKDLRDRGMRPELVILECPDIGAATNKAERKWICAAQADGPLFNVKAVLDYVADGPSEEIKAVALRVPVKIFKPNKTHGPKVPRRFKAPPMLPESKAAISAYLASRVY